MKSYHNTTHLSGPALADAQDKATTQEEQILGYFRECYRAGSPRRTPSEVWRFFGQKWPLTSVRRAITDLSSQVDGQPPRLERLAGKTKVGVYGKPEGFWQYVPSEATTEQLKMF